MKVFWTPSARQRLKEIEAYIAKESSRQIAHDVASRLVNASFTLEQPPLLGTRLPQYANADVRQLLERPYRLIFRVLPERIEIITVLHYRQLLPSDLQELSAEIGGKLN